MKTRHRGFTLVELMAVISIILVLIAILMPALAHATAALRQIQCTNNMRSLGQAFQCYIGDYDGFIPDTDGAGHFGVNNQPGRAWLRWKPGEDVNQSAVARYVAQRDEALRDLYRCPAEPIEDQSGYQSGSSYPLTTTINYFNQVYPSFRHWQCKRPSGKILLYDENQNADDDQFWYVTTRDTLAGRHGTRSMQFTDANGVPAVSLQLLGNVMFFDGHVELATDPDCHTAAENDPTVP